MENNNEKLYNTILTIKEFCEEFSKECKNCPFYCTARQECFFIYNEYAPANWEPTAPNQYKMF